MGRKMRNELPFIDVLWIGTVIGFIVGAITVLIASEKDFSRYTLNCVEQNMTLKQMAFDRFPDAYKLRFNDWNSTTNQLKEK
jgi:gas vesicle protein